MKSVFKKLLKLLLTKDSMARFSRAYSYQREIYGSQFADYQTFGKASNFIERFREIVSDPLNLLIERVPDAGYIDENRNIILHNGIRVPIDGENSYYGRFSDVLIINRGVHEPLEEFCFQELLRYLRGNDIEHTMLELGAYWGHYSLWFSKELKNSHCTLVEPDKLNFNAGKTNFKNNGESAIFINEFVSKDGFTVDKFFSQDVSKTAELTLLHSDIQGFEEQMLLNSEKALSEKRIKYLMISTHGEDIHKNCLKIITSHGYLVSVDSEPQYHTTSSDGFIFARRPDIKEIFNTNDFFGRNEIAQTTAGDKLSYLSKLIRPPV